MRPLEFLASAVVVLVIPCVLLCAHNLHNLGLFA